MRFQLIGLSARSLGWSWLSVSDHFRIHAQTPNIAEPHIDTPLPKVVR
ncbi:MAG TPA: hypothetical protein V6C95_19020 [Coleofasciculaceae cyanobacterium]